MNWLLAALDCNNCIKSIELSLAVISDYIYLKGFNDPMVQCLELLGYCTDNTRSTSNYHQQGFCTLLWVKGDFLSLLSYCFCLEDLGGGGDVALGSRGRLFKEHGIIL